MIYDKNSDQGSQSAKDVLEDIKKVIHNNGYNKSSIADQKLDNEDNIPYLQEHYDDTNESLSFKSKEEMFKNETAATDTSNIDNTFDRSVVNTSKTKENNGKQDLNNIQKQKELDNYDSNSLLSKENIDASSAEIQHLAEEVYKSRRLSNVTLEELTIKLLEPAQEKIKALRD